MGQSETLRTAAAVAAVFSEEQRELLRAILNRIVPTHGGLPGAGDLEVGDSVEQALAGSAPLRRLFGEGLVEVALASVRWFGQEFVQLTGGEQDQVLRRVECERAAFFQALVEYTYRGYYARPDVQAAIGFDSRPPQPLGHELPPFDPALLEQQRRREPFWRRVE